MWPKEIFKHHTFVVSIYYNTHVLVSTWFDMVPPIFILYLNRDLQGVVGIFKLYLNPLHARRENIGLIECVPGPKW